MYNIHITHTLHMLVCKWTHLRLEKFLSFFLSLFKNFAKICPFWRHNRGSDHIQVGANMGPLRYVWDSRLLDPGVDAYTQQWQSWFHHQRALENIYSGRLRSLGACSQSGRALLQKLRHLKKLCVPFVDWTLTKVTHGQSWVFIFIDIH